MFLESADVKIYRGMHWFKLLLGNMVEIKRILHPVASLRGTPVDYTC